jgi:hypothetical protein
VVLRVVARWWVRQVRLRILRGAAVAAVGFVDAAGLVRVVDDFAGACLGAGRAGSRLWPG